ncbi:ABC transporter substrate-binding protein, partial [Levilactobacillus brevis]
MATKTTVTNDGHTYTIKLKPNTKWSNGQPVTAQDFVYSWERML